VKYQHRGATVLEFALTLPLFLMFLLGILDFSRLLYTYNGAAEATRAAARYAVVCDDTNNKALVLSRMRRLMPQVQDIDLQWFPAGCTHATCEGVTVTIVNLGFQWISPIPGVAKGLVPMPTFSTVLTREVMRQDANSAAICS
jgi:hypothetical protein